MLPMLHKALRTRELSSYSFGNIALANVGNAVHSVYVVHLPPGPIWFLAHALHGQLGADALLVPVLSPVRRRRPLVATRAVPMAAVARGSQW
jgi:hypothetical protein